MLERDNVKKELNLFGKEVVSKSRFNFRPHNASGKGARTIKYDLEVFKSGSFSLTFSMADYMEYQDKGVSGKQRKFATPYRYTTKKPPAGAFDRWSIRRGIAPRNEQGQFLKRKQVNFALSNYIYKMGITPKKFFTNAFKMAFKDLPDDLIEAYGLDVEVLIKTTLNTDDIN